MQDERLASWLDGEMDEAEAQEFLSSLSGAERREAWELAAIAGTARRLPRPAPAEGFAARAMARVLARRLAGRRAHPHRARRPRSARAGDGGPHTAPAGDGPRAPRHPGATGAPGGRGRRLQRLEPGGGAHAPRPGRRLGPGGPARSRPPVRVHVRRGWTVGHRSPGARERGRWVRRAERRSPALALLRTSSEPVHLPRTPTRQAHLSPLRPRTRGPEAVACGPRETPGMMAACASARP